MLAALAQAQPNITYGTTPVFPIGEIQSALTASSGTGTYTWAITAGSLPPGLALRTDVPSFFNGATAGIIGIATTPGTYNFTLQVTANNGSATQAITMKITGLTLADNFTLPDAFVGSAYNYQLTPVGGTGTVTFTPPNTLPPGITFSTSGLVGGTPTAAGTNNNLSFTFTDSTGAVVGRSVNLNIYPLQLTSPTVMNATRGASFSQTLTASGGTGPYTFSSNGLPGGLSLSGAVISGTLGTNTGIGPFQTSVTINDSAQHSYTKSVTFNLLAPPVTAPYISWNNQDDCTIGIPCSHGFSVWNGGTAPFTWNVAGLPTGMFFRYIGKGPGYNPTDVEIWGNPTQTGNFNLQVTVTDNNNIATTQVFPLHVSPLGVDFSDHLPSGTRGTAYSSTLRVLGGTGPYTVTKNNGALPAGLSLSGLVVSGTPTENGFFNTQFAYADSASNTVLASSNYNISPTTITINSNSNLNAIPVNVAYSQQFFACCATSFTWSLPAGSALPTGLSLSSGGLLSGTPTVNGTYTFLVQATDTSNSANFAVKQFTLVVTPLTFSSPNFTLPYGNVSTSYSQSLLVNGSSGSLAYSLAFASILPPGLTLNASSGLISGTPTQTGQFQFTVNIKDTGNNNTLTRTYTLYIYANGAAPPIAITSGTSLGTVSIGPSETQLFSTGGNGTTTWTVANGSTLPAGCSLRPDFPSYFGSSATGNLSCVTGASAAGNYSFTLTASSAGQSVSQAFTFRVTALRQKDEFTLPPAFLNVPYSFQLSALGNAGTATWSTTNTNLPAGMSISSSGLISGTPTASGSFGLSLTISDGTDSVHSGPTFTVYTVQITSSALLPNATQNQAYTATPTASGGTGTYTWSANGLPAGLSINTSTGAITGTPTNFVGRFGFTLTAIDSNQVSYNQTAAIIVVGAPKRLAGIIINTTDDCTLGTNCQRTFTASNGGTPAYTWAGSGQPSGMSFRTGGVVPFVTPDQEEIFGFPDTAGTSSVQAGETDADGNVATQVFPVTVSGLSVTNFWSTGTRGVTYSSTMRVIGGTGQYTVTVTGGQLPAGLTLNGLTLSGTPLENGSSCANLLIKDSATTPLTLHITQCVNINDVAGTTIGINSQNLGTTIVNQSYSTTLSACCVPSYTWSLVSGQSAPPGLTLASSGILSGTPNTVGVFSFLVQAVDQVNSANASVRLITLTVTPVSITTSGSLPYGNVNSAYSQQLAATGASGTLTWTLQTNNLLPPGLTLNGLGLLSGTPTKAGYFSFTVVATDSSNMNAPQTRFFSVYIYAIGQTPPLTMSFGPTLGPNTIGTFTFQLSASGGAAPYHYSYTPGAAVVPGMRVLDGPPLPSNFSSTVTGSFAGVMTTAGVYTSSVRVTDAANNTLDQPFTWTVVNAEPLSSNSPPKATVGAAYSYTFTGFGGSGNYSWSSTNLPAGLSISSSGVVSGTPTAAGTTNSTINLKDLTSNISIGFGYSFIVNPYAITTGGVLPSGTQGSSYPQQTLSSACVSGCSWSIVGGSLPSGLSLSSGGVIAGTPTGFSNSSFLVQVSGSNGTAQKQFSLQIVPNTIQPLYITTGTTFGPTNLGNTPTNLLNAQGGTPPYTWSIVSGALPPGISLQTPGETVGANLQPGYAYLAGRAMVAQKAPYTFSVQVTDSASKTFTQSFSWLVPAVSIFNTSYPLSGTTLVYNSPYTVSLLAIGGSGNYTSWSLASGSLPTGLSLNGATGVVSGTPVNTGFYSAGIKVIDDAGNTTTQTVSFTVTSTTTSTINIGLNDTITMQAGSVSTFAMNPSGGTGPYTISVPAAGPALPSFCTLEQGGNALNNVTTAVYCAPTSSGSFTFTLQATDSLNNIGVRTITLNVTPFTLFSNTVLPNGSINTAYTQKLLAFDANPVTWTVAPGNALPAGLTITGNTISGTPTVAGSYQVNLIATDSSGLQTTYAFTVGISTIAITNPDVIPTVGVVTYPYSYQFAATGGGNTKTWTATNLPDGLTQDPTTGLVTGSFTGPGFYVTTITVTDGQSTFSRNYTFFGRYNNPSLMSFPLSATKLADTRVGASFNTQLDANMSGGTPPYAWTVTSGSLPAGINLFYASSLSVASSTQNAGTTYLLGAPTTAGQYTFTLTATDANNLQMQRTFTMNVTPMAIVLGTLKTATVGSAYSEQLTAVGGTGTVTFTYAQSSFSGIDLAPPGITMSSTGLISGTPTSSGNFSFLVTAQDSATPTPHTYTSSFTLTASTPVGFISTVMPSTMRAGRGVSTAVRVSSGSGSYTFTVSAGTFPPGLKLSSAGTLTGAPSVPGLYNFTVRATQNSSGNFAERVYNNVTVSPISILAHGSALPDATAGTPYSSQIQVAGGTPPYVFTTPVSLTAFFPPPPGLTISSTGLISGTPTQTGSYSFDVLVTDAQGLFGRLIVPNLNVLAPNQLDPILAVASTYPDQSVGTPASLHLDQSVQGGVPPFTYALQSGQTLPAGMVLLPGGNGVSAYLGGIPTGPANTAPTFTLVVTDSKGQTDTNVISFNLSPLSISPNITDMPNGVVGTPYSVALTGFGGTAPYTFTLSSSSGMPPGLTGTSGGLLSGTPTLAGVFPVSFTLTDNNGNSLNTSFNIVIDNSASQAQGISTNLTAIQLSYTLTAPALAPVQIGVQSTTGTLPFNALLTGIPGATLSATSGTAPTTLNLSLATNLTAGNYVGVLALSSPLSANVRVAIPVTLTVSAPPPCNYTLNPSSGSIAAGGGTNSFSVATGGLCAWTPAIPASADRVWITLNSGSGPGTGNVNFTIAPNAGSTARTGTITAGGQSYTVTQFGSACALAISPTSVNVTAAGGQASVNVTASGGTCAWTASGLSASPTSGTGNGSVTLTIPASTNVSSQQLTATVAGRTFTVNQGGVNCVVSLDSPGTSIGSGGGAGMVHVSTPSGCTYNTVNGPSWITVNTGASGAGPGPVELDFSVSPNSTTVSRSGAFTIGGQSFTVIQDPTPCSVTMNAATLGSPFGSTGGSGSIAITTSGSNCSWTASSGSTWANVTPTSGTGNGTVNVTVSSNAQSATSRSTSLTIAGQTIGVTEAGTTCTYSIGSTTASVPYTGGNGSVTVTSPSVCTWSSAADNTASWLTIASSGVAGTSDVLFTAAPNTSATPRSGTLTVAGYPYTVTQGAAPCSYTLNSTSTTVAPAGVSSSFTFSTTATGCSASAVSYSNWLTVSTSSSGDGTSGTISYTAAPNPLGSTRVGTIQFAGQAFTVNQTASTCYYSLTSHGILFNSSGGTGSVVASQSAQGCSPSVGIDQPTIASLGSLSGPTQNIFTQPFTVNPFNSVVTGTRRTTITFGGQFFVIKQTSW